MAKKKNNKAFSFMASQKNKLSLNYGIKGFMLRLRFLSRKTVGKKKTFFRYFLGGIYISR